MRGDHGRKAVGGAAEAGAAVAECVVELGVQLALLYRFAEEAVWAASDGREGFPILRNLEASKCVPVGKVTVTPLCAVERKGHEANTACT
jgi:hypothetical protein